MKKKQFILGLVLMFCSILRVNGASTCDYATLVKLNTEAANVKVNYEFEERVESIITGEIVDMDPKDIPDKGQDTEYIVRNNVVVNVMNITENIYVVIKSNADNEGSQTVYYQDANEGTYTFAVPDTERIREYTISVYSNLPNCKGESLLNKSILTPKFNNLSNLVACYHEQMKKEYYCQTYVTTDVNMTSEKISEIYYEKVSKAEEMKKEEEREHFWKKHGKGIIITIVVLLGVVTTVILAIRKRSRVK